MNEWLFRFGIVADLACAVIRIFLVLAFYRLFEGVDRQLAIMVSRSSSERSRSCSG